MSKAADEVKKTPKKTFKYESWIQGWYKGRKVSEY